MHGQGNLFFNTRTELLVYLVLYGNVQFHRRRGGLQLGPYRL